MLVDLSEAVDPAEVGGKAANLGRIKRAGFDVPDGFVITAAVHATADTDVTVPPSWRGRIGDAVARIGPPVAVRSTGVDEDGGAASFAGQFRSYLSLQTTDQVMDAVAGCWRSGSTRSAREYRGDTADTFMPVLVQRMVPADHAGVMFTQDPVTGDPSQLVVEAVAGLGDALCDGRVDPDRFHLDKITGAVRSVTRATESSPTSSTVLRLRDLAIALERLFGSPQDIEWAAVGEQIWVLQSRPITVNTRPTGVASSLIDMPAVFAPQRSTDVG